MMLTLFPGVFIWMPICFEARAAAMAYGVSSTLNSPAAPSISASSTSSGAVVIEAFFTLRRHPVMRPDGASFLGRLALNTFGRYLTAVTSDQIYPCLPWDNAGRRLHWFGRSFLALDVCRDWAAPSICGWDCSKQSYVTAKITALGDTSMSSSLIGSSE